MFIKNTTRLQTKLLYFVLRWFPNRVRLKPDFHFRVTMTAHRLKALTDESNGRREAGFDVSSQSVLHCESQVLKLPLVEVRTGGGHVEHGCDACCCQRLSAGRVDGTAQKQEGQQLHWTILQFTRIIVIK